MQRDHLPGYVPPTENFDNDEPYGEALTAKECAMQDRIAAEQAAARGNVSQGWKTGAEQLAYVAGLPLKMPLKAGWIAWDCYAGLLIPSGVSLIRSRGGAEYSPNPNPETGWRGFSDSDWRPNPDWVQAEVVGYKLAKSAGVSAEEKAAVLGDGWIEWRGGNPPVPLGTAVEVQTRNAAYSNSHYVHSADKAIDWKHMRDHKYGSDIVAYRLKPSAADPYAHLRGKRVQYNHAAWRNGENWGVACTDFQFDESDQPPDRYRIAPEGAKS